MPRFLFRQLAILFGLLLAQAGHGTTVNVPIKLDYQLVRNAVVTQLFTGPGQTAELLADPSGCNSLVLSKPVIEGQQGGRLRLQVNIAARGGTPLGNRCIGIFDWQGLVDTIEEPYLGADGSSINFRIIDSSVRSPDGSKPGVSGLLWDWIKDYVQPGLASIRLDLGPVLAGTRSMLAVALPGAEADVNAVLDSLVFHDVRANPESLDLELGLDVPELAVPLAQTSGDVLSEEELARWDEAWQAWDAFATWMVKTLGSTMAGGNPELTATLAEILLEARYELRLALATDNRTEDPVRGLFLHTWERLAPLLRDLQATTPEAQSMQFLAFIGAADALQALDTAAAHMDMRLDSRTFRSLARLLVPGVTDADLQYNTEVDPALRSLMGFDRELTEDEGDEDGAGLRPFDWLIPRAMAVTIDQALVRRLTGWVPARDELEDYITSVNALLEAVIAAERRKGKVPVRFLPVYEDLVLATAWQESCWRQYVVSNGEVKALKSSAGSVGLMQVNQHVWRGIYDIDALNRDIAYNARAGNEILVHYLVDHAIRRKEHEITGDDNSLARAAYAAYNGGPRHLTRYRLETTSKALQKIDAAFYRKYQAIQQQGQAAVKACFGN